MEERTVWFVYKYKDALDNEIHEDIVKFEGKTRIDTELRAIILYNDEENEILTVPLERVQLISRKMAPRERFESSVESQKKSEAW